MKTLKQILFVCFVCCFLLLVSCDDSDYTPQETEILNIDTTQNDVIDNNLCENGHTEVIDTAIDPTCTETGLSEGKHCSVCRLTLVEQKVVDALGHTETIDTAVAPTCTSIGLSEGKHCSVCDTVLVAQTVVAEKGHTEITDNAVEATCTAPGLTEGKHCSVCDTVLVEQTTVEAKGHTEVTDSAVEATCTEEGKGEGKHCSVCGEVTVAQSITAPKKSHTEVLLPAVKATCTKEGATEGAKCSVCGEITVEPTVLPAKGHSEVIDAGKAATCTKTGLTQGSHCTVCRTVTVAQKVIPSKGHTEVTVTGKPATCTQNGISDGKKCSVCGEIMIAQTALLATGHSVVIDQGYEATCAATGMTDGSHCDVCETVLVERKKILSPYHIFENDKCKDCGCSRFSQGIEYSLNSDKKSYTVIGMGTCEDDELIIPESYQDLPITAIKASAFENCEIISAVVPDSVTSIGAGAFKGCNMLEEITLPFVGSKKASNSYDDSGLFGYIFGRTGVSTDQPKTSAGKGYTYQWRKYSNYSTSLYAYYIPETLRKVTITLDTTIDANAFYNCDLIESISLPDGIESIGERAFCDCTALKTIDAGIDAIQTLGSHAFQNCSSLIRIGDTEKVIVLPSTLQNIGAYAFQNCVNFEILDIQLIGSIGSHAFDGCTGVKEVTLGNQITEIGNYAFANCPSTSKLILTEPLTSIGEYAFMNWQMTEIIVPDSVTSIGEGAFEGCDMLEEITLPFVGSNTSTSNTFGYIFGGINISYSETKTSDGKGYTYQYEYKLSEYGSSHYHAHYIPETLRKITITLDTTIPNNAFRNCDLIESISLPDGIESIGSYAFYNCTALKTIDAGIDAIQTLGSHAFQNCSSLIRIGDTEKVIVFPSTLQSIGDYAFQNCVNFEILDIQLIGSIGSHAFDGCTGVKEVTLGNQVTKIYHYAFNGCTSVKEVTLGNQITEIEDYAFANCPASKLILPETLISIGSCAFMNWQMTEVIVPDSVTSIESGAFKGCNKLETITLPFIGVGYGGTNEEDDVFGIIFGWQYAANSNEKDIKTSDGKGYTCQYVENFTHGTVYYIPETLRSVTITQETKVSFHAFKNCDLLQIISLPKTVNYIGKEALANCTDLTHLYYGGSHADWRDISLVSDWDSGSNYYYMHMYAEKYGLYIPTDAIKLQVASGNSFILLPLNGTVEAQAYCVRTHEIVSLAEANISLEIVRNANNLSLTNGNTFNTQKGGVAALRVTRNMGELDVITDESLNVFIVQCGLYDSMGTPDFSLEEKEYIVFCIDFVMSMSETSDPYTEIDYDFNYFEQLLYNASHITDYIFGWMNGDTRSMTVCKQTLAKFIQSYVDENYAHNAAVSDTEMILAALESAKEIVETYKDYKNFYDAYKVSKDGWNTLVKIKEMHELYYLRGITVEELKSAGTLLSSLEEYQGMDEAFRSAKRWSEFTEKTRKNYDSLMDAANRFDKALNIKLITESGDKKDLIEILAGGGNITKFKDIAPGLDDVAIITLDAAIYMLHNYTYNIEILEKLKVGFENKNLEDTLEYKAVVELITEYNYKEINCIQDTILRFGATVIVNIAKRNPVVSVVLLAADILVNFTNVEAKVEFLILDAYKTSLEHCIWPVKELYHHGTATMKLDELKTFTSIYLNLMKRYNELAINISVSESTDEEFLEDVYALNANIDKIDNLLDTYY